MRWASCLGSMLLAAAALAGEARVVPALRQTPPSRFTAAVASKETAPAATVVHEAPCCDHCQRGLLTLLKRRQCRCDHCVATVVDQHCASSPCCGRRPKFSFLRMICRLLGCHKVCCGPCNNGCVTFVEPKATAQAPVTEVPTDNVAATEPVRPTPVAPPEPAYANDYRWIQGRLRWVHVNGGAWVVRYAPLDQIDQYGGSMVLTRDARFDRFKEGDFVRIEGEVLSNRSTIFLGGPLYRVKEISLVQAAAPTNLR